MIRTAWRRVAGVLASTGVAVGLLLFVGAWSLLATVVPQGEVTNPEVTAWAKSNPLIEPVVRALGLHRAFTSYAFLACVVLLGLSTAVCSWRRTRVALSRSRALRSASATDLDSLARTHDLEIACDPGLTGSEILSRASDALAAQGIRTKRRADLLSAVSSHWSVWGSSVFHWSLVALIAVILLGQMVRSEGAMAVAVGEMKRDEPGSYLSVTAGPWHDWARVDRAIRVDSFDPAYVTGGIDRGAVPTVSVLDGRGKAVTTQRVYPNNMLHSGSLAINAPATGLSVWIATLDARGAETGRLVQYADFSQTATGGTLPVSGLTRTDATGALMRLTFSVPLDRSGAGYGAWIPKKRTARLLVTTEHGEALLDRVALPGEDVMLPGGGGVRLLEIGWYSRLSLVDDPTIPLVYATMIVAMLGLTMTVALRQQIVLAASQEGPGGPVLVVRLRLWRNVPTSRGEIERALIRALGSEKKESTP